MVDHKMNHHRSIFILLNLILLSQGAILLDSFGAKLYTLYGCDENFAMPAAQILHQEASLLDCARRCQALVEGCNWLNYEEDAVAANCEVGISPNDVTCTDLEQRSGATFYTKDPFCKNQGVYSRTSNQCLNCTLGWTGQRCNIRASDCSDHHFAFIYTDGTKGLYLWPKEVDKPFLARCDQRTTLIQAQGNDRAPLNNMNRTWMEYAQGFGANFKDFWLGNNYIHAMTSGDRPFTLEVEFRAVIGNGKSSNVQKYWYVNFKVANESEKFRVRADRNPNIMGVNDALAAAGGDPTTDMNGKSFSTYDEDNDGNATFNCANDFGGGWWYGPHCSKANLNGRLLVKGTHYFRASVGPIWSPEIWPQIMWDYIAATHRISKTFLRIFPSETYSPPQSWLLVN